MQDVELATSKEAQHSSTLKSVKPLESVKVDMRTNTNVESGIALPDFTTANYAMDFFSSFDEKKPSHAAQKQIATQKIAANISEDVSKGVSTGESASQLLASLCPEEEVTKEEVDSA